MVASHLIAASESDRIADIFARLVLSAGPVVLKAYETGCGIWTKADMSPVSEADVQAEAVMLEGLARLLPGIPVIAEEAVAGGEVPTVSDSFVLVDPLDGT